MPDPLTSPLVFPAAFFSLLLALAFLHFDGLRRQFKTATERVRKVFQSRISGLENENGRLTVDLDEHKKALAQTQAKLSQALPFQQKAEEYGTALIELERVLLDPKSYEEACEILLQKHKWIFWPDYRIGELHRQNALRTAVKNLFKHEVSGSKYPHMPINENLKMDLYGWASTNGSLQPGHLANSCQGSESDEDIILIMELKKPSVTIQRKDIEQAYAYATGLMNIASSDLWGKAIDCLVIGGEVADGVNDLHLTFGGAAHDAIRIIPTTYKSLIERAYRNCDTFLKELDFLLSAASSDNTEHDSAHTDEFPADLAGRRGKIQAPIPSPDDTEAASGHTLH